MADNFLEKRMDDYRRGMLGGKTANRSVVKAGTLAFRMSRKIIVVAGPIEGAVASAVHQFCECGCKVAFVDNDRKRGVASAQTTGSLFYPVTGSLTEESVCKCMDFVSERWGSPECVIIPKGATWVTADLIHRVAEHYGELRYVALDCSESQIDALQRERCMMINATEADESATAALIAFMILPVMDKLSGTVSVR